MSDEVEKTLQERGARYGDFEGHSALSQALKKICMNGVSLGEGVITEQGILLTHADTSWKRMNSYQKEAVEMLCHKLARILNGDPNYDDSWKDIAGYSMLTYKLLVKKKKIEESLIKEDKPF